MKGPTGKTPTNRRRNHGGGHLYVITNPAWPGYCKIGRTTGLVSRFRTYQTASPLRDYDLYYSRWFADVCRAERTLKHLYSGQRENGEWFRIHPDDAANLVDLVASRLGKSSPRAVPTRSVRHPGPDGP
ncbi:endonuclease [Rhizobium phage Pasto]|uniref:Endonuclease n=1 Tax=Rhizobium phage Pasto TaxID=2767575 RepID=A0A7S6U308_9CAUD|nr:endonuclease [Rhizobium phage Pasto]